MVTLPWFVEILISNDRRREINGNDTEKRDYIRKEIPKTGW